MVIQSVALRKKGAVRPLGLYLREVVEMKSRFRGNNLRCDARYIPNYSILEKFRAEECRFEYVYLGTAFRKNQYPIKSCIGPSNQIGNVRHR